LSKSPAAKKKSQQKCQHVGGECSCAISANADALVVTYPSWLVIPLLIPFQIVPFRHLPPEGFLVLTIFSE
jgi:hypothetical protein